MKSFSIDTQHPCQCSRVLAIVDHILPQWDIHVRHAKAIRHPGYDEINSLV